MDRFRAAFDAIDVNAAVGEVDGIPAQRHQLGRPQAVPIRDQDHGRITVAVAIPRGGGNQAGNLCVGQVLARTDLGVPPTARWADCPNNSGRRHHRAVRLCHES